MIVKKEHLPRCAHDSVEIVVEERAQIVHRKDLFNDHSGLHKPYCKIDSSKNNVLPHGGNIQRCDRDSVSFVEPYPLTM